ncbi:MAG: winged helix-turn-helix transcriptional regulator [Candidatus Pacebacteria bacterium]|nr:winged helix-turn-helix transcriptional regulator [Candidatus Paceibacterota bacterium]
MDEKHLEKILKALANKRRLSILKYLKSKPRASVGTIAGAIKLSFKSTSKHLSVLANVELLEKEQVGLTVYYKVKRSHASLQQQLRSIL